MGSLASVLSEIKQGHVTLHGEAMVKTVTSAV